MVTFPQPITAENFSAVWTYTARKRRWSIKRELIRRMTVTLAQVIFFSVFLILAFGIFYEMGGGLVRSFIDQIPDLGRLWDRFYDLVFDNTATELQRLLRCAGLLYLVPFGTVFPLSLLVLLLYYPRTPKLTGDAQKDAWQLNAMAKHVEVYSKKKDNNTHGICSAFMGMFMIVFVLGLLLFAYTKPELHEQVIATAHQANIRCFLYGLAMFVCYRIINLPLQWLLYLLHFTHIPKNLLQETGNYYSGITGGDRAEEAAAE